MWSFPWKFSLPPADLNPPATAIQSLTHLYSKQQQN